MVGLLLGKFLVFFFACALCTLHAHIMQVQHTFNPEEENCMCAMHTAHAWHVGATCMQPRFQFMLCVPTAQAHAHGTW